MLIAHVSRLAKLEKKFANHCCQACSKFNYRSRCKLILLGLLPKDMFIGGGETSSAIVEWGMSEMLRNPRVMEEAQAELLRG
ncbi:hypothetical protein RJT34_10783 [Clitoria ternatea]|uniref:Uncharacterized protein n=1 Tax=Clitoria ternatea TaxID=43366 RepID=A0AAN9JIT9_CLITE